MSDTMTGGTRPGIRRTDFSEVRRVYGALLERSAQLAPPWLLLAIFEGFGLYTAHQWFDEIGTWHQGIDNTSGAFLMVLFELPFAVAVGLALAALLSLTAIARSTFWSAMGEMVVSHEPHAVLAGLSLTRGLMVLGVFLVFSGGWLLGGCLVGFLPWLVVPAFAPFVAAPYFAGRRRSVGGGLRLSLRAATQNPAIVGVTAGVLIISLVVPEWLLVTGGQSVVAAFGGGESAQQLLLISCGAVALVGGYFGWVFAGAAFACMDSACSPALSPGQDLG